MQPCVAWQPCSSGPRRIQGIHQCSRVISARCSFSSKSASPRRGLRQHGQADHLLRQSVLPKSRLFLPVVSFSDVELARHKHGVIVRESTCSLANGEIEDGLGKDREQFSDRSAFQNLTRCLSIGSSLSARDLAGISGDEPGQHVVLRTDVVFCTARSVATLIELSTPFTSRTAISASLLSCDSCYHWAAA